MKLTFLEQPQITFLKEGGYIETTPQQRFTEIIDKVREYEKDYSNGLADRLMYMIDENIFSLSTPALANFGKPINKKSNSSPLPASCNIVTVGDSIADIYNSIGQVAMLSKLGAGVGSDFQKVAQSGTNLAEGFFSNSKLDWIEDSVRAGQKVSQGATRRGYNTPFISIEDNDFDNLIKRIDKNNPDKNDPLINNTVGIILPEGFRDKLTTNREAQRRYILTLKQRQKTGRVYLLDVENCNKNSSPVYKQLGLKVETTNICCVSYDTKILTDKGYVTIGENVDSKFNVWNGVEFSEVLFQQTGNNDELYRVTLDSGEFLDCTPNHNFYIQKNYNKNNLVKKQTTQLNIGDKLEKFELPIIVGYDFLNHYMELPKSFVPDASYFIKDRIRWLGGLLDEDGTVKINKQNSETFQITSVNRQFLRDVQLMLQTLGVHSTVRTARKKGEYYLLISSVGLYQLKKLGLKTFRLKWSGRKPQRDARYFSKVVSVEKLNGLHDTYCFYEPNRGKGMFNGMLTGQSEFLQPLFTDLTSVCVIGAINAVHWDKVTPQMIKDAFMFLDIMNEEYIKLTEGIPFMEKARNAAIQKRDIGLGLLGFHELLQIRGYAFGGLDSRRLNKEIFSTIRKYGEEYTKEIGEKLGSPKYCEMAGMVRRNASLMMVAPNKSTAFISGATSGGIEPRMSNIFVKSLAKIQHVFKNKQLENLLIQKGKNTTAVWDSITENNGSVQHLDFLTKHEKDVFKTFSEISPKDIIDLAADRQVYIDMGQSLNLVLRKNYTMKDIYDIHKYGWDKGIKTFYYAYSSAHAALEKDGGKWDDCISCAD